MLITEKDERMIALLRDNARASVSELARQLGVSRTAAQARLNKLERHGVSYRVHLSETFLKNRVRASIMIKAHPANRLGVERNLSKFPTLTNLYSINGMYDLMAVVSAQNVEYLDRIIDDIGGMEGVEDTMTSVILSTKIDR